MVGLMGMRRSSMAFQVHAKDQIGCFVEKETGNHFEYSQNTCPYFEGNREFYPHIVWVGGDGICGMSGYRYANVKKTVAYVIVNEDENGPILERWQLKSNKEYVV
jgi:hypothetical protein